MASRRQVRQYLLEHAAFAARDLIDHSPCALAQLLGRLAVPAWSGHEDGDRGLHADLPLSAFRVAAVALDDDAFANERIDLLGVRTRRGEHEEHEGHRAEEAELRHRRSPGKTPLIIALRLHRH
jgi:hypothetical protein